MDFFRAEIFFFLLVGRSLILKILEIALKLIYILVFDLVCMMTVLKSGYTPRDLYFLFFARFTLQTIFIVFIEVTASMCRILYVRSAIVFVS